MQQLAVMNMSEALAALAQLFQSNAALARAPEDVRAVALRKVFRAVDRTRMFLDSIRGVPESEREPNPELMELWTDASLAIAAFDPQLAYRLRFKAEYWSRPRSWNVEDVDIGIDNIADAARQLIVPGEAAAAASRPPVAASEDPERLDVFISHASEDKDAVAEPLANELRRRGYGVWYDDFMLRVGDNLRHEIDKGLALCRYAAVILSPSFISKDWTNRELDGMIALEVSGKDKRILPVLHGIDHDAVVRFSPILGGRVSVPTSIGIGRVADELAKVLDGRDDSPRAGRPAVH